MVSLMTAVKTPGCGVAIGDMIFDVTLAEEEGILELDDEDVFCIWHMGFVHGPWARRMVRLPRMATGCIG